jgi:uncharacterized protein
MKSEREPDVGFHEGELIVQRRAGVAQSAARLSRMMEPAELTGAVASFLSRQTFAALTGRDLKGRLWISPFTAQPGFLYVASPITLVIRARPLIGDPLYELPVGQAVGIVAVEFALRRRVRVNGTLVEGGPKGLTVSVEQAYGNCPQYIQRRVLPLKSDYPPQTGTVRLGEFLSSEDFDLIRRADTFFLGTTNPQRGSDASHRGGPAGFVRAEGNQLWWPDFPGNNLFNSFGNIQVNPEAALLFADFDQGNTLQLSGTAKLEWGEPGQPDDDGRTGRRVRFAIEHLVARHRPGPGEIAQRVSPRHPGHR